MNRPDLCYLRKVQQQMHCSKKDKVALTAGLRAEIRESFSDLDSADFSEIVSRFGSPEVVAAELESALPQEVLQAFSRRQRLLRWAFAITAILIVFLLVLYIIDLRKGYSYKIYVNADVIYETNLP